MHIHRWTKWEDVDIQKLPLPTMPDISYTIAGQTRICTKCNKRRTRKVRME